MANNVIFRMPACQYRSLHVVDKYAVFYKTARSTIATTTTSDCSHKTAVM